MDINTRPVYVLQSRKAIKDMWNDEARSYGELGIIIYKKKIEKRSPKLELRIIERTKGKTE